MRGNWKGLAYLGLAFEIPLLTVLGYFVGAQLDAALGLPGTNIIAGVGIVAGLYLCWLTFRKIQQFVDDPGTDREEDRE